MVAFAKQFDPLGNWTNFKQDTDADSDWELDQNRTHNKANEIAAIGGSSDHVAHESAGNMTRAPKPENWASHYHFIYDPWNRLVEVQTADQSKMVRAYEYDGLDRMIGKWSYDEDAFSLSEWRHYYYSDKWQFLEERVADSYTGSYSGSGIPAMSGWGLSGSGVAGTFRLDRQFVWGLRYVNDLVLRDRDTDSNGSLDERIYALQDPNWNVVAIANTSGVIQERYCYDAYGKPSFLTLAFAVRDPDVSSYDWETLFCGYRYDYHTDSDVKWHIAGHRILLSHLGRWNRRDPILDDDNPHRYVRNNPVIHTDSFGLFIEDWYPGAPSHKPPQDDKKPSKPQKPQDGFYVCQRNIGPGGDLLDETARKCGCQHTDIYSVSDGLLYIGWGGGMAESAPGLPGGGAKCKKLFRQNNDFFCYGYMCYGGGPRSMKWGPEGVAGKSCSEATEADIAMCLRSKPAPKGEPGVIQNCQSDIYDAINGCCLGGFKPGKLPFP